MMIWKYFSNSPSSVRQQKNVNNHTVLYQTISQEFAQTTVALRQDCSVISFNYSC